LMVVDSASDPIPAASKGFDVNTVVRMERRVGLKNLHVVDAPPGAQIWTELRIFGRANVLYGMRLMPHKARDWSIGFLLPASMAKQKAVGVEVVRPPAAALEQLRTSLGKRSELFDLSQLHRPTSARGARLDGFKTGDRAGTSVLVLLGAPARGSTPRSVTIVQESAKGIVGGSTYLLRVSKRV
jgi:hypothetical protein